MSRMVIDYMELKAHIEERIAEYAKKADEALCGDDFNCCEYAQYEGFYQAYIDMHWDLMCMPCIDMEDDENV